MSVYVFVLIFGHEPENCKGEHVEASFKELTKDTGMQKTFGKGLGLEDGEGQILEYLEGAWTC